MVQPNLAQLTPYSTLASLTCYQFKVDVNTLGQLISDTFKNQPEFPGVIIMQESQVVGVISKRKFFERMSQPFSLELYLKRPIQVLLNTVKTEFLQLPNRCKIEQAARLALSRAAELVYEPILVTQENQQISLLDIHDLLLAQTQILSSANTLIQQQHQQAEKYLGELKSEQGKVKKYTNLLEEKNLESEKRNNLLETQQAELQKQAQQISALNQQFIRISHLLSIEGKKAFQATFAGVNSICGSTEHIVSTGNILVKELETIHYATEIIDSVSKQVRHLAVQAALTANQSGGQVSSLSYIATEISNLGVKTVNASTQVNEIVSGFKDKIGELTAAAKTGETTARSLIQKIQKAEIALAELEELVSEQKVLKYQPQLVELANGTVG